MSKYIIAVALAAFSTVACSSLVAMPEATGEVAQAATDTAQAIQSQSIGEVINMDVNIPIKYILLYGLAWWCVRTPWGLVADFIKLRRG
ncbi:hypothetical protein HOR54_gp07 [Vibrio phage Vp670]|uniref:Uncharacterized protein n=1 Tax=Vibrio phage Vp670 TaxID=1932890 RepID=A0A1L7DPZ6_9CAUD|nr:hypothetical protein HOR54_gp07 [Vibrio phage Vp670]APU00144.1 hypothetical protein QD07_7 [Vibrio phage Vp670]